ncbi:cutinase 1-like isoform X1 [Branchiostoma lanceolatum]|uniref:cutinase 1-like isoform X1 n=2 Tax=Branchiostoma lanceolatum TaxID=7740 RepID=UPI00345493A0
MVIVFKSITPAPQVSTMPRLSLVVLFGTFLTKLWTPAHGFYVDHGNPYDEGNLEVLTLSISQNDAPMLTKVYYPTRIDTYAVLFFTGGYQGDIPSELYSDVLVRVASHGFVVIGVDYMPMVTVQANVRDRTQRLGADHTQKYFEELRWVTKHLEGRIAKQLNRTGLVPDFNHLAIGCHSAGCDPLVKMTLQNHTFSKAALLLEPFSFNYATPVTFKMPAFILGTELSTQPHACVRPGHGYNHFYNMRNCPRMLMEVKGHGHCDIYNETWFKACQLTHFCKTNPDVDINKYHKFIQGISAAFLTTTLQGRDKLQYITNTTALPVELLEFKIDMDC